jgi:caa(3)-type oxidase subunit IV
MSNKLEEYTPKIHGKEPYEQVFAALFVVTLVEISVSYMRSNDFLNMESSDLGNAMSIGLLIILAIAKVSLIASFFMHLKYERDPKLIVVLCVLIPLIGITMLTLTMYFDFRGVAIA